MNTCVCATYMYVPRTCMHGSHALQIILSKFYIEVRIARSPRREELVTTLATS